MSRSFGATSLTTRSPMRIVPVEASSSPASTRSAVVLPDPDGPTRIMNSPSPMRRSRSCTAAVPSGKTLLTPSKASGAMPSAPLRPHPGDEVAIPEAAALRDAALGLVVDVDDPEAPGVAVLPLEVVQERPRAVAAHVGAVGQRLRQRDQVAAQVGRPLGVVDPAVARRRVLEG